MQLLSLQLENFRNHRKIKLAFDAKNTTIISGKNGTGKTSLLEAIYMLALTKSFRTRKIENLIQWEQDFFRIRAELGNDAENEAANDVDKQIISNAIIEQCVTKNPKKQKAFKKNNVMIPREKFLGNLSAVMFRPEDLAMLTGEPSLRRQYLNNIFIQTDPRGLETLQEYHHALIQRNMLLKSKNTSTVELWNTKLSEAGERIQKFRTKLVEFFTENITQNSGQNSEQKPAQNSAGFYQITYTPKIPLQAALEKSLEMDLKTGWTSVGPHREDMIFTCTTTTTQTTTTRPIAESASRGELRRLMMQLKKAEIEWIQLQTKKQPLLLLDDIFSELDTDGKAEIMEWIAQLPHTQTIMTIAEGNTLPPLEAETIISKL